MHTYLLVFLLLFAGHVVQAQVVQESSASQTFKQKLRGQYLQNDTAQALINLYSTRQGGGAGWIGSAILAGLRIATASSSSQSIGNGYVVQDNRNDGAALLLVTAPIVGYGVAKMVRYSNGNLERVLTDYTVGKPLAPALRRKLKPRFFAQPIIKYQSVNAVPVK